MIYELEVQNEASLEIIEAYMYYENAQKGLGERFLQQVESYFLKIQNNPKHFQLKRKNYRESYIHPFPYVIIFDIIDKKIIVLSVFCTHQNPERKP